jgi:hypothetical protein
MFDLRGADDAGRNQPMNDEILDYLISQRGETCSHDVPWHERCPSCEREAAGIDDVTLEEIYG